MPNADFVLRQDEFEEFEEPDWAASSADSHRMAARCVLFYWGDASTWNIRSKAVGRRLGWRRLGRWRSGPPAMSYFLLRHHVLNCSLQVIAPHGHIRTTLSRSAWRKSWTKWMWRSDRLSNFTFWSCFLTTPQSCRRKVRWFWAGQLWGCIRHPFCLGVETHPRFGKAGIDQNLHFWRTGECKQTKQQQTCEHLIFQRLPIGRKIS